jgi:hypothetical protein
VQHSDQLQEFSKKKGKQLKASAAIYFETPQGETITFNELSRRPDMETTASTESTAPLSNSK